MLHHGLIWDLQILTLRVFKTLQNIVLTELNVVLGHNVFYVGEQQRPNLLH